MVGSGRVMAGRLIDWAGMIWVWVVCKSVKRWVWGCPAAFSPSSPPPDQQINQSIDRSLSHQHTTPQPMLLSLILPPFLRPAEKKHNREPRVRVHQPDLRLLRRVQAVRKKKMNGSVEINQIRRRPPLLAQLPKHAKPQSPTHPPTPKKLPSSSSPPPTTTQQTTQHKSRRYNIKLWKTFTDCFNCLPVAAVVDEDPVHGPCLALFTALSVG